MSHLSVYFGSLCFWSDKQNMQIGETHYIINIIHGIKTVPTYKVWITQ